MKKDNKVRLGIFASVLVITVILGFILYGLLYLLITSNYRSQMTRKLAETNANLDKSLDDLNKYYDNLDRVQTINAELAVYYTLADESTDLNPASMKKLANLLSVYNVVLLDPAGNIIASAHPVDDFIDFKSDDLENLLDVVNTGSISKGIYNFDDDHSQSPITDMSLYSALLDHDHILVIMSDISKSKELSDSNTSWQSVLERNSIGQKGFTFGIDTEGTFVYYPYNPEKGADSDPVERADGLDVSSSGISLSDMTDGEFDHMTIFGEEYYCAFKYRSAERTWLICAIPETEIRSSVLVILIPMLFTVFILLSTLALYFMLVIKEYSHNRNTSGTIRSFFIKKSKALFIFSLLTLLILSVYIQFLYATSVQESINRQDVHSLAEALNNIKSEQKAIKQRYDDFLLNVSGICARFLSDNPDLATHSSLENLNNILKTQHLLLYDKNGTVIGSDSTYLGLSLSKDPEDPSYEFREILYGTPYVIQDVPDEDYLEKPYLYIGSLITTGDGIPDGFIQLAIDPEFLETPLKAASKESLLSTYSGTNGTYAFSVDMKTREYSYHPRTVRIGKPVIDYGLTETALRDGYVGYIQIKGVRYFAVSAASNDDYVYTITPVSNLTSGLFKMAMLTFIPCMAAVFLMYLMLYLSAGKILTYDSGGEYEEMASAESSVLSDEPYVSYEEYKSEELLKQFVKGALLVLSGVIFIISQFYRQLLPEDSIFVYIIRGAWDNGVHLFSITWCVIFICSAGFLTICLTMLFKQLGQSLSSKTATMVHMLISLLKYGAIISIIFGCAKRLGVQTDTLLASAGILTIVIGLGAQSLTSDVFDGLFIIIEGSFHVGDIISVDDGCWGRVLEIGIRNTKILDFDYNNVKILNNNSLKHIVNHSKCPERIFATIATEYGDDLRSIEEVIAKELPEIKKNLPWAVKGPDYLGVDELADSAVVLKFSVHCNIDDYYKVKRGLNRELKLMFDRNGINVPFPQIVLNQREE